MWTRLCLFVLFLSPLVGCATRSEADERLQAYAESLIDGHFGPGTTTTPAACPPLTSGAEAAYTCTSTVGDDPVTWAVRVIPIVQADGASGDSVAVDPEFDAFHSTMEWIIVKEASAGIGAPVSAAECPPEAKAGTGQTYTCTAMADGVPLQAAFRTYPDDADRYTVFTAGITTRKETERMLQQWFAQNQSAQSEVRCPIPAVAPVEIGQQFQCEFEIPLSGQFGVFNVNIVDAASRMEFAYEVRGRR